MKRMVILMTEMTKYWVDVVKNNTILMGKIQQKMRRYIKLLHKALPDTSQYEDIKKEIDRLQKEFLDLESLLLILKCAALTNSNRLSKSAKKNGFVTNFGYRDYLIDQFIKQYGLVLNVFTRDECIVHLYNKYMKDYMKSDFIAQMGEWEDKNMENLNRAYSITRDGQEKWIYTGLDGITANVVSKNELIRLKENNSPDTRNQRYYDYGINGLDELKGQWNADTSEKVDRKIR